jgi:hypothetical protein
MELSYPGSVEHYDLKCLLQDLDDADDLLLFRGKGGKVAATYSVGHFLYFFNDVNISHQLNGLS